MEKTISIDFTREELEKEINAREYYNLPDDKYKKALEQLDAPQIGDRCAFWDNDMTKYSVGTLEGISDIYYYKNDCGYKHWYVRRYKRYLLL
jgi:hypothetical protein